MKTNRIIIAFIAVLSLLGTAFAADANSAEPKRKIKSYPLDTCVVTENDLDSMGGAVTRVHEGQEVKFCCRACIRKFEKDPKKYLLRMERAVADEAKVESKSAPKKP